MPTLWKYRGFDVRDLSSGRLSHYDLSKQLGLERGGWHTHDTDVVRDSANDSYIHVESGDDWVYGGAGHDVIVGYTGDDILYGGTGNDFVQGGRGDDSLYGGSGNDLLMGGRGADTFGYRERNFGEDTILKFKRGEGDKIDFRGSGLTWSDLKISDIAGGGVMVDAGGGNRIRIQTADSLTQTDFLFGDAPPEEEPPVDDRPFVSVADVRVSEGDTATVRIELSKAYDKDVQVGVLARGDTADAHVRNYGQDFKNDWNGLYDQNIFVEYITIKAGQTSADLTFETVQDSHDEENERFFVSLSDPKNARYGSDPSAVVTIVDDDAPPEVSIGDVTVAEDGTVSIVVELSQGSERSVAVDWSIGNGQKYELWFSSSKGAGGSIGQLITIDPDGTVTMTALEPPPYDWIPPRIWNEFTIDLPDEAGFTFTLSDPTNANLGQKSSVTIGDDGPPELSIGDVTVTEGDTAELTIELSRATDQKVVVYYRCGAEGSATCNVDYVDVTGGQFPQVVFAAGETSKVVTVDTVGDTDHEGDESFSIELFYPSDGVTLGAKSSATVTIVDDDAPAPSGAAKAPDSNGDEALRWFLGASDGAQARAQQDDSPRAGESAPNTVVGTRWSDILDGSQGADEMKGRGGDDFLYGNAGGDVLYGNAGDDVLYGGEGADTLEGGRDGDELRGGEGNDTLLGGSGNDRLEGGAGNDRLVGGSGSDRFIYEADGFGNDRIGGFEDGADQLDFSGLGLTWSDLSVSSNRQGHAVVRVNGMDGKIVLEGIDATLIGQDDFIF